MFLVYRDDLSTLVASIPESHPLGLQIGLKARPWHPLELEAGFQSHVHRYTHVVIVARRFGASPVECYPPYPSIYLGGLQSAQLETRWDILSPELSVVVQEFTWHGAHAII